LDFIICHKVDQIKKNNELENSDFHLLTRLWYSLVYFRFKDGDYFGKKMFTNLYSLTMACVISLSLASQVMTR